MPRSPAMPVRRWRLALALTTCVVAAPAVAAAGWRHLPDPIATRWTVADRVDATMPKAAAIAIFVGLPVAIAVLVVPVRRSRVTPFTRRAAETLGVLSAGLIAASGIRVLLANAAGRSPGHLNPLTSLISFAIGLAVGLVMAPGSSAAATRYPDPHPARSTDVWWRGTTNSRWALPASLLFALFAVVWSFKWNLLAGASLALVSAATLSLTSVVVQVDRQDLRVCFFGGLRWPAIRIPVMSIRTCQVIQAPPVWTGGRGHRGHRSGRPLPDRSVNLRAGPALLLEIDGDRRFLVTVDDATQGCQAVRDLIGPGAG